MVSCLKHEYDGPDDICPKCYEEGPDYLYEHFYDEGRFNINERELIKKINELVKYIRALRNLQVD